MTWPDGLIWISTHNAPVVVEQMVSEPVKEVRLVRREKPVLDLIDGLLQLGNRLVKLARHVSK